MCFIHFLGQMKIHKLNGKHFHLYNKHQQFIFNEIIKIIFLIKNFIIDFVYAHTRIFH